MTGYKTHSVDGVQGEVSLLHVRKRTVSAQFAAGTNGTYGLFKMPAAGVITAVRAFRTGGSAGTVQIKNITADVLASALATTTDAWAETTTVQNASVLAGSAVNVVLAAAAGSPTGVTVEVDYTVSVPA